jgi:hypothetical protein
LVLFLTPILLGPLLSVHSKESSNYTFVESNPRNLFVWVDAVWLRGEIKWRYAVLLNYDSKFQMSFVDLQVHPSKFLVKNYMFCNRVYVRFRGCGVLKGYMHFIAHLLYFINCFNWSVSSIINYFKRTIRICFLYSLLKTKANRWTLTHYFRAHLLYFLTGVKLFVRNVIISRKQSIVVAIESAQPEGQWLDSEVSIQSTISVLSKLFQIIR